MWPFKKSIYQKLFKGKVVQVIQLGDYIAENIVKYIDNVKKQRLEAQWCREQALYHRFGISIHPFAELIKKNAKRFIETQVGKVDKNVDMVIINIGCDCCEIDKKIQGIKNLISEIKENNQKGIFFFRSNFGNNPDFPKLVSEENIITSEILEDFDLFIRKLEQLFSSGRPE